MLFNSFPFLIFFPAVLLVYFILPKFKMVRTLWLLAASYFFYMSWNPVYGLLLLFCTVVTYLGALMIQRIRNKQILRRIIVKQLADDERVNASFTAEAEESSVGKKFILFLSLLIVFSLLCYFKYANFLGTNLNRLFSYTGLEVRIPSFDIVLPVGISFFTFQAAGYLVDVYRGDTIAEKNFFRYALFVSFFPQLVAGPIERSRSLLKQLNKVYWFSYERARDGLMMMLWGYFLKMVVADRAAVFVNAVYGSWENQNGAVLLLASVLFAFQIYGDFGGYSMIARGAAKIMGIDLMDNFDSPYFSCSTREFWRRWHISLNTWFVDYVYIPLGGSKKGRIRSSFNTLIVFFLSGIWHGASWNFVIWGVLNGFYQVIGDILKPVREFFNRLLGLRTDTASHSIIQAIITFLLIDISWVFFRASSVQEGVGILKRICQADFISMFSKGLEEYGLNGPEMTLLILAIVFVMVIDCFGNNGISVRTWLLAQGWIFRILTVTVSILFIVIFGVWGSAYDAQSFIYFQF